MELLQKKDNRLGIIISIALHLFLLIAIFFSKGCMELQNPPQFTLEEVITLDFSDAGGGSPGSASPTPPTAEEEAPAEKVITQEESPVAVKSSNSTTKNENATKKTETKEVRQLSICRRRKAHRGYKSIANRGRQYGTVWSNYIIVAALKNVITKQID